MAVLVVAGLPIERPAPRDRPAAIGVTLLAGGEESSGDAAEGEAAPPVLASPAGVPEPAPSARPVAKSPAPARAASPSPESPVATAETGSEVGAPSDDGPASAAEPGAAAAPAGEPVAGAFPRPAPGSGAARPYGEHDVDRVAGPIAGIRRPSYPARERMLGREGRVSLLVTVDPDGVVRGVQVTRSAGEAFDAAARRAVEATPFRPAERRGLPVASTVTVNVSFELD